MRFYEEPKIVNASRRALRQADRRRVRRLYEATIPDPSEPTTDNVYARRYRVHKKTGRRFDTHRWEWI